ncbi:helix-turn-helix transcriptional regulator [Actinacidiphila glaucinigra]|uniref:helix-turn-helix domain-containing protein n=1 Tax=Actinacidiphila glaucinigra TaxID=235986 RepID=UPI0033BC1A3C
MGTPPLPIGARIRSVRERTGRTQAAVAGPCGIAVDYLSQIERGIKTPSLPVLQALAAELGVPVAALLGETPARPAAPACSMDVDVAQALMGYGLPRSTAPTMPAALRERVEAAWRIWQNSPRRYTDAAGILPQLIADTEHTVRTHRAAADPAARREVLRAAADLYFLLRSYCRRTGRVDLSLMVADRGLRAAEDADDPIRIAAAQWNLGHVLLADGDYDGAEHVTEHAIEQLTGLPHPEGTAMAGALDLVAVVADARRRRPWQARHRLQTAALPRARRSGEGNTMWTVFGPTNVGLHGVSIDMESGDVAEALRAADRIDTSCLPSRERHFTFLLEVARCYDLRREDPAVLVHLLDLEDLAPEDLARSPLARDIITGLRRRVRPTYRRQVEGLAERLDLTG